MGLGHAARGRLASRINQQREKIIISAVHEIFKCAGFERPDCKAHPSKRAK